MPQSRPQIHIINFLDIDTNKITFTEPKPNKHKGSKIGILYNGKTMYVQYEGTTPFVLKENLDENGNCEGKTLQINCENKYLDKAKELDRFFMNVFF